ncbi:reverse transcriptase/maturase family protein [Pseudomonas sp. S 311-6]|nr:reverse transcriptase/maturase family protein [Pseudomonas sp. S 311-6]
MERLPIRGGNWNNGATAGLGALNLNNARSNANNNIGFRPRFRSPSKPEVARLKPRLQRRLVERMPHPRRQAKNNQQPARGTKQGSLLAAPHDMKTFNNLFEKISTFDALYAAYRGARRGKRDSRPCMYFERRLEENIIGLLNDLEHGSYRVGPYRSFAVHEPKTRTITALTLFRDRVLQHAIVTAISPIWEARFISDSYACRIGKGTHAGADRVQEMMRECLRQHGRVYALKADVRRYFASIHHDTLKSLLARRIADRRMLALLFLIIDSYHTPGCPGYGIPIGSLTSQLFANIYLDALDQHVKCRLRVRWYVRYMDDWVIIGPSKAELHGLRLALTQWLDVNLGLELNQKTQVFPVSAGHGRGLDFLGYHMWPHRRRLRKASLKRFKRRVRRLRRDYATGNTTLPEIRQQLSSWLAHAKHGHAQPAVEKFLSENPFIRRST